jgi:hypothetical protein
MKRLYFRFGQGAVEHGHAADPAGEADAARTVDDPPDRKRPAAAVVGGGVETMRIPPRVQSQGDEVGRRFSERGAVASRVKRGIRSAVKCTRDGRRDGRFQPLWPSDRPSWRLRPPFGG